MNPQSCQALLALLVFIILVCGLLEIPRRWFRPKVYGQRLQPNVPPPVVTPPPDKPPTRRSDG